MHEHGYNVQWQLINSANYIAHKRERVYIIATKQENAFIQKFPIHSPHKKGQKYINFDEIINNKNNKIIKKETSIFTLNNDGEIIDNKTSKKYEFNKTTPWKNFGVMINGEILTAKVKHEPKEIFKLSELLEDDENIDEKYLLSKDEESKQRFAKSAKTWKSGNKMGNMTFPDSIDKPCRTLTASSSGREMMVISYKDRFRKMTAKEYFRCQGFSDIDYNNAIKAGVSELQIKKQAGNAVTATTIEAIAKRFIA